MKSVGLQVFYVCCLWEVLDGVVGKKVGKNVGRKVGGGGGGVKSTGSPMNEHDVENVIHPPCEVCKEDEFYELENTEGMFQPGYCFGLEMPFTLTLTGLGMMPYDWWHSQIRCQRWGGYLYEPIGDGKTKTLDNMKLLATEAHNANCPHKRRKSYQEYWTGHHFQPDFFNQNDQPELIGASTGMSLENRLEHKDIYLDYFYDANPNRNASESHPNIFDSCVEMSSSTHQDSLRTHGRLNDDDCWVNNLPLCGFSYIGV